MKLKNLLRGKRTLHLLYFLVLLSGIVVLYAVDAASYPRFAALTGSKCMDCHVSPSGGSMRNAFGLNYAKENLQMDFLSKYSKKVKFNPEINKSIYIGGDIRTAYLDDQNPNSPDLNTFLTMQGDLYVNAKLNDFVNVFVAPGIQLPNIPTKPQVYGMISNLPLNIFLRAGRFTPNYGINIPEHRAFQRIDFLNTPYSEDAGLELGLSPGVFNFSIGMFNGIGTDFFDNDRKKMVAANVDLTFSRKDQNFNVNFGTSFYNNPYDLFGSGGTRRNAVTHAYSGYTKIGILQKIAVLGEVDFKENTIESTSMQRGLYGFAEADYRFVKGFELRAQYEYKDPNRDLSGDRVQRYSMGCAFFPLLGIEAEIMIRFLKDDSQPNTNEYFGQLHFYF
ncbi:MAG TPA: hypothetical protein PK447_06035 [Ignavibacteria bacterium]|nr:hypothetical protein [Ignavibacteria bacterium]